MYFDVPFILRHENALILEILLYYFLFQNYYHYTPIIMFKILNTYYIHTFLN